MENKKHSRLYYNQQIVDRLKSYLYQNQDVRFTQALFNLGINENLRVENSNQTLQVLKDKYNEESEITFKNLK